MIREQEARQRIQECYRLDKYTTAKVAKQLMPVVTDASELTSARIGGAIISVWRHASNAYSEALKVTRHYYDGGRQQIQAAINEPLRVKLEGIRIR